MSLQRYHRVRLDRYQCSTPKRTHRLRAGLHHSTLPKAMTMATAASYTTTGGTTYHDAARQLIALRQVKVDRTWNGTCSHSMSNLRPNVGQHPRKITPDDWERRVELEKTEAVKFRHGLASRQFDQR